MSGTVARARSRPVRPWRRGALASFVARFVPLASFIALTITTAAAAPVQVGSKRFTESYVLGEVVAQTLVAHGIPAIHRAGLGNTGILVAALAAGEIDVYPEYTGTIVREILKAGATGATAAPDAASLDALNAALAPRGLKVGVPLGFSNSYALAMRDADARSRGIERVSDLADPVKAKGLVFGLSNEFLARGDGWPALKRAYGLPQSTPSGLDHGLAYDALATRRVDLIDVYSTDARIGRDGVRVLVDDRRFFPRYDAVLLMRAGFDAKPLAGLAGAIDNDRMIALNARAELDRLPFDAVAREFLQARAAGTAGQSAAAPAAPPVGGFHRFVERLFGPDFWTLLVQHLVLVGGSVAAAIACGVPLGVWAARRETAGRVILGVVGVLQTVPSLAMLALLIAAFGTIGTIPALVALFLYALLPIVANTHAGVAGVPRGVVAAGTALGLTPRQCLGSIELPLAAPTIIAGVRTAAVINVGTATVAAFVGAGGFGERITAGLALNDAPTLLAGAVPAAVLALVVQVGFDVVVRRLDAPRRRR